MCQLEGVTRIPIFALSESRMWAGVLITAMARKLNAIISYSAITSNLPKHENPLKREGIIKYASLSAFLPFALLLH